MTEKNYRLKFFFYTLTIASIETTGTKTRISSTIPSQHAGTTIRTWIIIAWICTFKMDHIINKNFRIKGGYGKKVLFTNLDWNVK